MSKKIELGEWRDGGHATIDLVRLMVTRALIQANSGGGKSWVLRRLIEITAGLVQQIIIDPEGEFATLREKHDFIIVAGTGGDALAHPKIARLLAIRLLETHASAVIDLSEVKASDRHAFVRLFIESLIDAPKALRHDVIVALDEAHLYCPEKGQGESEATDAVIDLATRGRKRGLCLVAATQRIGKFNKSAAAELKNKLIGSTGLDVDVKRAAFELGLAPKDALAQLRSLDPGHFFGFGPAFGQVDPREMIVGTVLTSHPRPGQKLATVAPKPTEAIKALLPKLADLPKEAEEEARTVDDLRKENAQLKRELKAKPVPTVAPATVSKSELGSRDRRINALSASLDTAAKLMQQLNSSESFKLAVNFDHEKLQASLAGAWKEIDRQFNAAFETMRRGIAPFQRDAERLAKSIDKLIADGVPIDVTVEHQSSFDVRPVPSRTVARVPREFTASASDLGTGGKRRIMIALAQYPEGLSQRKLSILTDISAKGGTWRTYMAELRGRGWVEGGSRDLMKITEEGITALGSYEPLPTGTELIEYWRKRLGDSGKRKIFDAVVDAHPSAIDVDDVSKKTGISREGGTWRTYMAELRGLGLVEGQKELRASEDLYS